MRNVGGKRAVEIGVEVMGKVIEKVGRKLGGMAEARSERLWEQMGRGCGERLLER